MRILVICQYYYPENFQITPICEQLVQNGHKVTVVTGLPNYPIGIVPKEYRHGNKRDEIVNGVHILRCYEIGRRRGPVFLALNYLSFLFSAKNKIKRLNNEYDIVFVYQLSPVLMAIPGIRFANRYQKPLFLYCCDLWPESLKMYIKSENNLLFKYVKHLSGNIYRACDLIAVQSYSFVEYINGIHNVPKDKLVYLPAFAEENYLSHDFTPKDECTDFVFLGNLGKAQNLLAVLQSVLIIRNIPNFKVHFVGDGSCLNEMKRFVDKNGLNSIVVFHGRKPVTDMPIYYKLADVCLVSLKADNKTGLTLPSKVQGYMAAGKPIIGMITGAAKVVIEESKCGVCVEPDDIKGLSEIMKDFILNKHKYLHCGQNGRDYFINNFRKAIFLDKLEVILHNLLN